MPNYGSINNNGNVETAKFNTNNRQINYSNGFSSESINLNNSNTFNTQQDTSNMYYDLSLVNTEKTTAEKAKDWFTSLTKDKDRIEDLKCSMETKTVLQALEDTSATFDDPIKEKEAEIKVLDDQIALSQKSGLSVSDPNYNIASTTYSMEDVNRMINERNQKQQELNDLKAEKATVDSYLYQLKHSAKLEPYDNIAKTEEFQSFTYDANKLNEIADIKSNAEYMSEEQKKMYAYLYNQLGEDSATSYLEIIQDEINQAKGAEQAAEFLNNLDYTNMSKEELEESLSNYFKVGGKGLVDGIDTFCTGIENAIASDGVLSADDYAKSIILQELSEKSTAMDEVYQFSSSFGNMVIPMISSAVINTVTKTDVGNKVGSALMGISAYGNAKEQALVNGNSRLSSTIYGIGIGVSETTLGYFLGKIPGLSSESGFTLRNLLSEGIEEGLQEYVDAGMQAMILGEDVDWSTIPENALKSFAMGFAMAGVLNGSQTVLNIAINGKKQEVSIDQLVELMNNTEGNLTVEQIENIATTISQDTIVDTNTNAQVSNHVQSVYSYNATGKTLAALASEYTSVLQQNMSQVTNQSIDTNYNEINVKTTDTISLFESQSTIRESRSDLNADQIINSDIDLNQEEIRQILHMGFETTMLGELINKDSDMSQAIYDINKFLKGKFPTYAEAWQRIHENWAVRCSLSLSQVESFYDGKGVKIDVNSVQSNYFEVYFHEVGHALLSSCLLHYYQFVEQINPYIHYYGKKIMDNEPLLVNYWKEIMSNATVIAEQEASSKTFSSDAERLDYVNNLSEAIIRNSGFASVIDIYDALTGGKAFSNGDISYGHGSSYYKNRHKDTQFQEMFADFHALKCINNAKAIDFGRKLIGDDIWNILETVYDVIINHKISGEIGTIRVLADRNAPKYRSSNLAANSAQKFDHIIQNMSQVTNQSIDTNYDEISVKSHFQKLSLDPSNLENLLMDGLNLSMLVENGKNNSVALGGVYDIHNYLINHNSTYRQTWEVINNNKHVNCDLELSTNGESYHQRNQGIRISNQIVLSNSIETYFHEIGHALLASNVIDFNAKTMKFDQLLSKHKKSIMKNNNTLHTYDIQFQKLSIDMANQVASQKKFNWPAERTQYIGQLREGIERNSGFAAISDIYDAVTNGKARDSGVVSYGHGSSYYTSSRSRFHEIFANFHAIICINNPTLTKMAKTLLGDEIWDFLLQTYNEAHNTHITSKNMRTTDARSWFAGKQVLSAPVSSQQKFDYVVQNMSQKYPDWLVHLQTYARDGYLNHITRYNHCRSVVQDIPLAEFKQMVNSLDSNHIITSMAEDQMLKDLPRVVNQFLSNEGTAYHKLININSIAKDYPSLYEYNQFMNKYSEQNGYMILDQNGYFKHIKYGIQPESIEHRLYINCEPTVTYQFLDYFAEECKRQGLSFYFKTAYLYDNVGNPQNQSALTRSESAVIYMSGEDAIKYINICKKIKHDHPELNFYAPPVATGSIDGWLGYGKEPSGLTRQIAQEEGTSLSFNGIRSRMLERGIYAGIKDCISKNMNLKYRDGNTLYSALANELFREIITQYPNLSSESQIQLHNNLYQYSADFMRAINSSNSSFSFYARAEGSNQLTTFVVNSTMVNTAAINVYTQYLAHDPAVYTYIENAIKQEAIYYYIDTQHLYMEQ